VTRSAGTARPARHAGPEAQAVIMGLSAAIVAVQNETPDVLAVRRGPDDALPFGPFEPLAHRTLDSGLRGWVSAQTGLDLGYVEQLYTFGDRGRHQVEPGQGPRVVSVGYLALTREAAEPPTPDTAWRSWYGYFPWEDWREARPAIIDSVIRPGLDAYVAHAASAAERHERAQRVRLCFGFEGTAWDEEKVLERYELLYAARLVVEAQRDGRGAADVGPLAAPLGEAMAFDHRRILATAMGRLRGKLKYRPVVFELMPPSFTLSQLQRVVEAIAGLRLHTQNFRRLVEGGGLVEATGKKTSGTGGRPASLFRFRREVLSERPAPGVKVSRRRG